MALGFGACCAESALLRLVSLFSESEVGCWETQERFGEVVTVSCAWVVIF